MNLRSNLLYNPIYYFILSSLQKTTGRRSEKGCLILYLYLSQFNKNALVICPQAFLADTDVLNLCCRFCNIYLMSIFKVLLTEIVKKYYNHHQIVSCFSLLSLRHQKFLNFRLLLSRKGVESFVII